MIDKIGVHHTGPIGFNPFSSSANLTLSMIEAAHKGRDFNLSDMEHYTGYTFVLPREGGWIQTRKLGEMTCAAIGHNFDTIHIVFIGNFTLKDGVPVDRMTPEQRLSFVDLTMKLLRKEFHHFEVKEGTTFNLSVSRIFPHRLLQTGKTTACYGDYFNDTWARDEILTRMRGEIDILQKMLFSLQKLLLLIQPKTLGANERECCGFISIPSQDEDGAVSASPILNSHDTGEHRG